MKRITLIQWGVIALLVAYILIARGCHQRELAKKDDTIAALTLENQTLDSTKNKLGQEIYTQQSIITSSVKAIGKLTDSIFNLKKKDARRVKDVIAYYSSRTKYRVDTFPVPYTDSEVVREFKTCEDFKKFAEDSMIAVPRNAKIDSAGFSIDETVTKKGIVVNHMEMTDSEYVRVIEKKGGFFRKVNHKLKFHVPKSIEFQSFHTNPNIHVTGQNSVIYVPKNKPGLLLKAIILGAGVYIGTLL